MVGTHHKHLHSVSKRCSDTCMPEQQGGEEAQQGVLQPNGLQHEDQQVPAAPTPCIMPDAGVPAATCSSSGPASGTKDPEPAVPLQHVQGIDSLAILDHLTGYPTSYLLNTQVPAYRSHAAHQQGAALGWHNTLSPMVFHTEAGMVLYDRVVTSTQEGTLIDKLCKPKEGRAPNSCASKVVYSGGAGAPTWRSPHHSPRASPLHSPCSSPHRPRQHAGAASMQKGGVPFHRSPADTPVLQSKKCGVSYISKEVDDKIGAAAGRLSSGQEQACDRIVQRQRQWQVREENAAAAKRQHYFQQQRATMTATQVFTWGGRLSHRAMKHAQHDRSNGRNAALATIPAVTGLFTGSHKAPLRLDSYQED